MEEYWRNIALFFRNVARRYGPCEQYYYNNYGRNYEVFR